MSAFAEVTDPSTSDIILLLLEVRPLLLSDQLVGW